MSYNTFGTQFRFTTWGESHGAAIGCVVDGVPPGIALCEADIQPALDQRRPGGSALVTQRKEDDIVTILSGVFDGLTTGSPVMMIIHNQDQRSRDYSDIKDRFRPGHADMVMMHKYGLRDYRGGGRTSARETAMRVAAGAVAKRVVQATTGAEEDPAIIDVRAALVQIGEKHIDDARWDWLEVDRNSFFCPDANAVDEWDAYLRDVRKNGASVGACIKVVASGVPAGWGEPVYGKLDADLAGAMMSINAVKGVEIGAGMAAAGYQGPDFADQLRMENGQYTYLDNNAGGVLGGISSGQDIVVRFAVKPTSSFLTPTQSVDAYGNDIEISTKGRHDPCVGIRAVPVGIAMMWVVLADHMLRNRAQTGRTQPIPFPFSQPE